jgi:phosphoribosylanthranilate isomerase
VSVLIKICGVTRESEVAAAVEAGADAVGFVFHEPSRRNLAPERAALLASALPPDVLRVAVTLHPLQALVRRILDVFVPDVWQSDAEDFAGMPLPAGIQRWPVLRSGQPLPRRLPLTVLYDAEVSGNGLASDWKSAALLARRSLLILAGGLNASTVGRAIASVRPAGVDVSSGVESVPGLKDATLIRAFVAAARAAERSVDS